MKKTNLVIAIICAVVCVLGWIMMTTDNATQASEYKEHVTLADSYMEEGLYQRAILEYKEAFDIENTVEVAEKIATAYALRYEEDPEGTYDLLQEDLEMLLGVYPANEKVAMQLAQLYIGDENYTDAYFWLKNAVDNGAESNEILKKLQEARYAFSVRSGVYNAVKPATGKSYVVSRNDLWGMYHLEQGALWDCDYEFVSQANADGVVLVTMEKDSRLIDGEGMVLGIFKEKVVDAGIYGDGKIAVSTGGSFAYYDEFAKKLFGDYEEAGTFVDGRAAVKKGGKWQVVDDEGAACSDSFTHIVLNVEGEYISNELILAAATAGQYKIYDEDFKEKASLGKYEAVDILTADGMIAVCQNGKWGFVNTDGEMVIKPAYDAALSFSNGLAAVCKDGLWGYINLENTLVIDYQFLGAGYFNADGATMVCVEAEEVEVEVNGEVEIDLRDQVDGETSEGIADETESVEEDDSEPEYKIVESWSLLTLYNGIVEDEQ